MVSTTTVRGTGRRCLSPASASQSHRLCCVCRARPRSTKGIRDRDILVRGSSSRSSPPTFLSWSRRMGTAETSLVARSSSDDGGSQENESTSSPIQAEEDRSLQELKMRREREKAEEQEQIEKGQRTAVFTGAIAIALGVAYLVLVSLLDSRGSVLQPPPPEAFL